MSDHLVAEAEKRDNEHAAYDDWVHKNADDLVHKYNNNMMDTKLVVNIDDVPNDWLSDEWHNKDGLGR